MCCVVDDHPRFHLEVLRWFVSLTDMAGVDPRDLVVHVVGSGSSDALAHLEKHGVVVRSIEPFDPRSPHCNKIAGALRMAREGVEGVVVLCDTDVVLLEDPRSISLVAGSIGGKVVDTPVPPIEVLHNIFAVAGIPTPPAISLPWGEKESTVAGNSNGGLYLVPASLLPRLATAWETWARWLLDRRHLLLDWTFHADQVAMVLALTAEGIDTSQLDVRWNTPVHDLSRIPADPPSPAGIHYHQEVDSQGHIRTTGHPSIDVQIERVNRAVARAWKQTFPASTFWRWWNLAHPALAFPPNGRDAGTFRRRDLLASVLGAIAPSSVLEVGCGDGETTRGLPLPRYVGIERSAEAIGRARSRRPEGEFLLGSLSEHPVRADLTVCLDLLHLPDDQSYREQVSALWASADRALLISGSVIPPGASSPASPSSEPLCEMLAKVAPDAECYPIGGDGEAVETIVALRRPAMPHPRDLAVGTLTSVIDRHPDPLALLSVRLEAQRVFGFFPDHAPRVWEYPVVVRLVTDHFRPGSRVADVGAGITPVAPFLTHRGYVVETVDPSDIHRVWPPGEDWNEWGYLDYAEAGLANRSWNSTLGDLPESSLFDCVLSISVIEHVPATDRRALLKEVAARVRPGGLMILTVDLERGGDGLWNRNRGQLVDKPSRHGSFQDVITEGVSAGFELVRHDVVRDWGDVEVDIGLIVMRREEASPRSWKRAWRRSR